MKRRRFLALAGLIALPVQAQSPPRIGYLLPGTTASHGEYVPALLKGLAEFGLADGADFALDVRYAEGKSERYAALLSELIQGNASVLVVGSTGAGLAAKRATATIAVVVVSGDDPVSQGLVASVSRPGGNVTAISLFSGELIGKRLGLLFELVPEARQAALLVNPNNPNAARATEAMQAASRQGGRECVVVNASTDGEIDAAFATLAERKIRVLLTDSDPFLNSRRDRIVALANDGRIVANYPLHEYVTAGGFSSYGVDYADSYRQAGVYAGKILRGAKPAELPVLQPTKFQLVVNLKASGEAGLTVSPALLAGANEVIE
jgi:putative tryptophan/tyrosine transport system substrate-binding protein